MTDLAIAHPTQFDITGDLPRPGVTLLEASAGTGKTFTIAALVARFVAEGVPVDRILAVTFTRMATAELRGRVRDRLVASDQRLSGSSLRHDCGSGADLIDGWLASGSVEAVAARRSRLAQAVADFDAATITTTHGFCHLVLASLGVSGSVGLGAILTEDAGDVLDEAVEDLYVRRCLLHGKPFPLSDARTAARAALSNPGTELAIGVDESSADLQRRLALAARVEVARRLTEAGLLTYDDVLSRLSEALGSHGGDGARGAAACRLLRERYDVVLVDEFQDTDPMQWSIVKNAFGTGGTVLVLIGDPKQAIYSFRGGDVHSYLEAARLASNRFTLSENWRSDAGLVKAHDALLAGAQLGHPEILYRRVSVPDSHVAPGLVGAPSDVPMRVRVVRGCDDPDLHRNNYGVAKASAEDWVARDVADDVKTLLASRAQLDRGGRNERNITSGDIAVLVRTNRQAQRIQDALRAVGVPVVAAGADSVFSTVSAKHWLRLLEALEQPASRSRAAAVALTPFVGMSAKDIATAGESEWETLHARLHTWAEVLRRRGVAALFRWVLSDGRVQARTLMEPGGPRTLTDLAHIAQLLHSEGSISPVGTTAMRAWLSRRVEDSGVEGDIEERTRRLESDADAVQVLTIHRAKGLEFPVVYCPFLWDSARGPETGAPVVYHDPERGFARMLDVGTSDSGKGFTDHRHLELDERRAEDLRLLYVALTRAQHQLVLWWVRVKNAEQSPLYRVLAGRRPDGSFEPRPRQAKDAEVERRLEALAESNPGCITVERCSKLETSPIPTPATRSTVVAPVQDAPSPEMLATASFTRDLDLLWRRTSYSSIVSGGARGSGELVATEPEQSGTLDEPLSPTMPVATTEAPSGAERALRDHRLPLAEVPSSAGIGTFVHRVLERVDFAVSDLRDHVGEVVACEWDRRPPELDDPATLAAGLAAAIRTSLGPLAGGGSLSNVARAHRLDEVGFELPLAGGDSPRGAVITAEIARLFDSQLDVNGPLQGYGDRLANPTLATDLRGYLTGSLDLVFRTRTSSQPDRYFVADYKTNRLAGAGEEITAWHYRPEALDSVMQHAHYPLQAILYTVALHRYLRWRLRGYDPERNLGGVLYLFLRGMTGPECPVVRDQPCGVFAWKPPTSLVVSLSDLFDMSEADDHP